MKELIQVKNFIQATRDSGYRGTYSALAEIIDNSLEAEAKSIEVKIEQEGLGAQKEYTVSVIDDGVGMSAAELNSALQFGGSSKFNSRSGLGRYGMGLPNSSLSQAKRIEVVTWKTKSSVYKNHLDIDEIVAGKVGNIGKPMKLRKDDLLLHSSSGTIVKWMKCDRLSYKNLKSLMANLHLELGRIFRYALWKGVKITVNNEEVIPIDPLFMKAGNNLIGGNLYGKELIYDIRVPGIDHKSKVAVRFIELPLERWSHYSNEEKQGLSITKRAGFSIVRAMREIDYGWFFTGSKKKENYDDWWRCEVSFSPDLDELFGVTHTKQEINPTEELKQILTPDIQNIARELNNRVRNRFIELKKIGSNLRAKYELEKVDGFISPPIGSFTKDDVHSLLQRIRSKSNSGSVIKGLKYYLDFKKLDGISFFISEYSKKQILVQLNSNHPFYSKVYHPLLENQKNASYYFMKQLEILIFAAARAESILEEKQKKIAGIYRDNWSQILAAYLT